MRAIDAPEELKARIKANVQGLVQDALEDVEAGRVVDDPQAMERLSP